MWLLLHIFRLYCEEGIKTGGSYTVAFCNRANRAKHTPYHIGSTWRTDGSSLCIPSTDTTYFPSRFVASAARRWPSPSPHWPWPIPTPGWGTVLSSLPTTCPFHPRPHPTTNTTSSFFSFYSAAAASASAVGVPNDYTLSSSCLFTSILPSLSSRAIKNESERGTENGDRGKRQKETKDRR